MGKQAAPVTLADEIARAAVTWARDEWGPPASETASRWILDHWAEYKRAVKYACGLLDARTPSPNSPATGGRP